MLSHLKIGVGRKHTGTASTPAGFLLPHVGCPLLPPVTLGFLSGRTVVGSGSSGSVPQFPKSSSSALHCDGTAPGQQSSPKISQFSKFGTQGGSGSTRLSLQHPSPKRRQSGPSSQGGGSVTIRGPPCFGSSSSQHLVSKRLHSGGGMQSLSSSSSPPLMNPPLGSHPNLSRCSFSYWAVLEQTKTWYALNYIFQYINLKPFNTWSNIQGNFNKKQFFLRFRINSHLLGWRQHTSSDWAQLPPDAFVLSEGQKNFL